MKGNNAKSTLLVLLTAAVVILGALLPGILASYQERSFQPGYADINSVELHLSSDEVLSMKDAISLVCNSLNTLSVSEDMTTRTQDEILTLAQSLLQPYIDRGLILAPDLNVEKQTYSCIPYLTVSEGEPAASVLFWEVLILFDEEEPALLLGIEDQTGTLVILDYYCSKTEFPARDYFVPDETMTSLCRLYLDGLGSEFDEYTPNDISNHITSDGVYAQHWNFSWEGAFGPAGISFDVWPHGITVSLF